MKGLIAVTDHEWFQFLNRAGIPGGSIPGENGVMARTSKFSPEVRERASEWAAERVDAESLDARALPDSLPSATLQCASGAGPTCGRGFLSIRIAGAVTTNVISNNSHASL